MINAGPASRYARALAERNATQGLSLEIVSAAHVVLQDLRRFGIELGGAYERALASAVAGGEVSPAPAVVAAIEAGRQAVAHSGPHPSENRRVHAARVEIHTLHRFTAADREFEPNRHYRLTGVEFSELERRAALEPARTLYIRQC